MIFKDSWEESYVQGLAFFPAILQQYLLTKNDAVPLVEAKVTRTQSAVEFFMSAYTWLQ